MSVMTNAQRQPKYRAAHLGADGDLARVTLDLRLDARDRLAVHYRLSLVELVANLVAASAERAVEARLSGEALEAYRAAGYEDETPS